MGFGLLDELGVGVGLGELGFGLGVVLELSLGVGVVVSGEEDTEPVGDEDPGEELDAEELDDDGLDEGLSLADVRDAEVLGDADLLVLLLAELLGRAGELADLLADGEELPDSIGDAEVLARAELGPLAGRFFVAAESTVLFGISGQAAELMID